MYSKEESQSIKKIFWISFSKKYPRKWLLYNTKIKDVGFKFHIDNKKAAVMLDIEVRDENKRKIYYEKIDSLKEIIKTDFLPDVILERNFYLDNGKCISRIWVEMSNVSINNSNSWEIIQDFFYEKMTAFELFYYQYEDYIKNLEINT